MSYDPDFPNREQKIILKGYSVMYQALARRYRSVRLDPTTRTGTTDPCTHQPHVSREAAWNCAERRAK